MFIPFYTLLRREISRFLKVVIQTVFTPLISSFLYLLVFGVSLGKHMDSGHGVTYLSFLIPGLAMMGLMNNAFQNSGSSIVIMKFTGELEDFRVVPITNDHLIWALSLGAVVRGAIVGMITFVVGSAFHYLQNGEWIGVAHPLELIFFVVTAGLVFGNLGVAAAMWAKSFDQMSAVTTFLLLPLTYLGGVFISIKSLSPFWQNLSLLNPLLYFINGIRHAILGVSDVETQTAVIISLISLVVFHFVAKVALRKGSFQRW